MHGYIQVLVGLIDPIQNFIEFHIIFIEFGN
jgi:hypothetical protein